MLLRPTQKYISFLLLLQLCSSVSAFSQEFDVKHYTTENGLPHNITYQVLQDSQGFIWIGTDDGLSRFDGSEFKNYNTEDGLSNPYIIDLVAFADSSLLVTTWGGGLNRIKDGKITAFRNSNMLRKASNIIVKGKTMIAWNQSTVNFGKVENGNELNWSKKRWVLGNDVKRFFDVTNSTTVATKDYSLWLKSGRTHPLGTNYYLNEKEETLFFGTFQGILKYIDDTTFIPFNEELVGKDTIFCIQKDVKKNVWFGGKGKIYKQDVLGKTEIITKNIPNESIWSIRKLTENQLLFITGLYNLNKRSLFLYNLDDNTIVDIYSLLNTKNTLAYFETDKNENIWITTDGDGVYQLKPKPFSYYDKKDGLQNPFIFAIEEGKKGEMWIGTKNGLYSLKEELFERVQMPQSLINGIQQLYSYNDALLISDKEYLFLLRNNNIKIIHPRSSLKDMLILNDVLYSMGETTLAVWDLKIWDVNSDLEQISSDKTTHFSSSSNFKQLVKKDDTSVWLISDNGLLLINKERIVLDSISIDDGLLSNKVNCMVYDKNNIAWIASEKGLSKWEGGNKFTHFTQKEGLLSNKCRQLAIDKNGHLWIGSQKGLSRFDGKNFLSFNEKNGLLSADVTTLFVDSKNQLWVGSNKGISVLDIDGVSLKKAAPHIELNTVKLNGELNSFENKNQYDFQSSLRFDFSVLAFEDAKNLEIQYQLNNQSWQKTTNHFIELVSLNDRNYSLKLRAKRLDSSWSEPLEIQFSVNPPMWRTWWAFVSYFLLLSGLLFGFVKRKSYKLEQEKRILERTVMERTFALEEQKEELKEQKEEIIVKNDQLEQQAQKLLKADKIKSEFFANISHEFRTPLTLILLPIQGLLEQELNQSVRKKLAIINRNAFDLLTLINQLLDLSKSEHGHLKLKYIERNIISDIQVFSTSFKLLATNKNIGFLYTSEVAELYMKFDFEKLKIIINNLLSNAVKFTPENGEITLDILESKNNEAPFLIIKVQDSGIGISLENLEKVFDRFYQVDSSLTKEYEGTGIGLALTKDLVKLHNGEIKVESKAGKGALFTVILPIIASGKKINDAIPKGTYLESIAPNNTTDIEKTTTKKNSIAAKKKTIETILIVEDNNDMRTSLSDLLANKYHIETAKDGLEGLEIAKEVMPDLVLSDIMMPRMTGTELCEKLKTNELTSHIPVILLTAKAGIGSKLQGLELGADDYLTKPFNQQELLARIKNLIDQRAKLRKRFGNELNIGIKEISTTSSDEFFLQTIVDIIEAHLKDVPFNTALFYQKMKISKSQFSKKLKALTDKTPTEFNRAIRLKKGASLLRQRNKSIAQIAFEIGFKDAGYFSRRFSEAYGISPSKYIAQSV